MGTTSYSYDPAGQLLSEAGPWSNDTVNYFYSNRLREAMTLQQPNADAWLQTYAYDGARRLTNTASPAGGFAYQYDGLRQMQVGKLSLPNGALITKTFDSMARMLSTELLNSGGTNLNSHTYTYNHASQRTSLTRTEGGYMNYAYDNIGQLTQAQGYETNGTARLNETLGYGYDSAHNLNLRTNNALIENFTVNSLNELSSATHTGTLTVAGTTGARATNVSVNGSAAAIYVDNTFALAGFTVTNGNNSFTAIAHDSLGRWSTNTVTAYLPTPIAYSYDLNGNLLSDGKRNFVYDGENQLIIVYVTNTWQSQFIYDGKLRRRIRRESTWQGSGWLQTNEVHYIYDGNVVIQERDINNLPTTTYTRGADSSGSFQDAGGIGGLLAMSQPSVVNPTHYYYHADGNGNITALINVSQILVAKYLYDSFGNTLAEAGPMSGRNFYRFSSKEWHVNSGLLYYLYRYYEPNLQRWLNRDPVDEQAGFNLYKFVENDPLNSIDTFGTLNFMGTTLGGPWQMFYYLFYGDLGANVTISSDLINRAKQKLDSNNSSTMLRLEATLKKSLACGRSGNTQARIDDNSFTFESSPGRVNMGNWQVSISANCAWNCSPANGGSCCCQCKVDCKLKVVIRKTYTFQEGYNFYNSMFGIKILNFFAWLNQMSLHLNSNAAYFISAHFDDTYSTTLKPRCN